MRYICGRSCIVKEEVSMIWLSQTRFHWTRRQYVLVGLGILLVALILLLLLPTLSVLSFHRADPHPLYVMHYYGPYDSLKGFVPQSDADFAKLISANGNEQWLENQACSLFVAAGDNDTRIYGRNRDMPVARKALLLYTAPPDGYASVSLVDLAEIGFATEQDLQAPSIQQRVSLLLAPLLPTEGMNEYGLTIAKADLPRLNQSSVSSDKENVNFRTMMRLVLDHARNTREAIGLMESHNISFGLASDGHYLIGDSSGDAAVVEFHDGRLEVVKSSVPWQVMTNFWMYDKAEETRDWYDYRYRTANAALVELHGIVSREQAMTTLEKVSVPGTVWSSVFNMKTGDVDIAIARDYANVFHLTLPLRAQ
jgi:penicillin V acylase-like amidase (Ntn superfamily)